jgi:hypothetical protein
MQQLLQQQRVSASPRSTGLLHPTVQSAGSLYDNIENLKAAMLHRTALVNSQTTTTTLLGLQVRAPGNHMLISSSQGLNK